MKKKTLISIIAVALVLCVSVGGVLAWLTAKTNSVVNTFTVGDINIDLTESENLDLKMVPGKTITKDPKVTVEKGSEASWLFVKVEKSTNAKFDDFMTYEMADGWTALEGQDGVFYREVAALTGTGADDMSFEVIKNNTVTVKAVVTKTMLNGLTAETYPTLTFTAYAIQKDGFTTAAAAWAEASK